MVKRAAKKPVTRSKFAELAGVSPAAITRALEKGKRLYKAALPKKRVDSAHPVALEYIAEKTEAPTAPAIGIDPLYEEAVALCVEHGRCGVRFLKEYLKVGNAKAKQLVETIRANDAVAKAKAAAVATPAPDAAEVTRQAAAEREQERRDAMPFLSLPPPPEYIEAYLDMPLRDIYAKFGTEIQFLDWLKANKEILVVQEKRIKNEAALSNLVSRSLIERGVFEPVSTLFTKLLSDCAKAVAVKAKTLYDAGGTIEEGEVMVRDQLSSFIKPAKRAMKKALQPQAAT